MAGSWRQIPTIRNPPPAFKFLGFILRKLQVYIHLRFENLETDEVSVDVLNELVSELKNQIRKSLGVPSYVELNVIISDKYNQKIVTIYR